jgi:hypothetical protein
VAPADEPEMAEPTIIAIGAIIAKPAANMAQPAGPFPAFLAFSAYAFTTLAPASPYSSSISYLLAPC